MQAGKRKRRHAYSLIELIVSIFVVGLLLSSVATALIYCNQYMRTCETKAEAQEEALKAAVWLSRYLQDANITAMAAQTGFAPSVSANTGIAFESVRDPVTSEVDWANMTVGGGVIEWPQQVIVYYEPDPTNDPSAPTVPRARITARSIPNGAAQPYPLDPPLTTDPTYPMLLVAAGAVSGQGTTRVLARNINFLAIEIYSNVNNPPNTTPLGPNSTNTINITIGAFAPYYGLNYGVNVSTAIRPQN